MLNLLRFREVADDGEGGTGVDAYARYSEAAQSHLSRVGGEIVWAGGCSDALIGPTDREWDVVALVRYPSRSAFLEMVSDADYLAATHHRTGALADSRLIPCAAALAAAKA
ncbi:MAG: hypothetical protein JWM71_1849 [Solirubrobacteraceae bacterium]|nr:hypothetical protein [Solirubrobacteraceae bacterium]